MTTKTADEAAPETVEPSFAIDPKRIEAFGRSVAVIVGDRLCEGARAKLKPGNWRNRSFKELRKLVRDQCAEDNDYLSAQAPVLEAVFRLLLVMPEEPVSLSELHIQLTHLWMTSPWPRHITIEALDQVLARDNYYGIVRSLD